MESERYEADLKSESKARADSDTASSDTEVGWVGIGRARPVESSTATNSVRKIGRYRLERLLGQGGMAQVHLAVREDDYTQKVALKRVLASVNHDETLARFVNERQILAGLEHPSIARLLDGGTDEEGFPFLVMEYVEGSPIDSYCESESLNVRERLRLFRQVCRAVHYAHQNLVVHRDLKPSNILVTADGQVRLLDFGIAKLLAETREADLTTDGHAPMTPAFASPEQVLGEPVTTASDVYALGVLLYNLLCGHKPYDFKGPEYAVMVRKVCLEDPLPPSRRVEETIHGAPKRSRERRRLRRALAGDLDAIVMKAMRKEPGQRYDSAAELEADIDHYFEGAPVLAHQGNWIYHTGKFLRRNRPAVFILALIVALAVTSTFLWRRSEFQRAEALTARDEAQALSSFLTGMLKSADPDQSRGAELTVREVVDAAQESLETELADRPETQVTMLATLGSVYDHLGLYREGLELAEKAIKVQRAHSQNVTFELATLLGDLARSYYNLGDLSSADRLYEQAIAARRAIDASPEDLVTLLSNSAAAKGRLGKFDEAESLYREVLDIRLAKADTSTADLGSSYYGLGCNYLQREQPEKALSILEKALNNYSLDAHGLMDRKVAAVMATLAEVYLDLNNPSRALELLRQSLSIRQELLSDAHPSVPGTHKLMASAWLGLGEPEKAAREIVKALELLGGHPEDYWGIADARSVLGAIKANQGQREEALRLLETSYRKLEEKLGPRDRRTRIAYQRLLEVKDSPSDARE